MRKDLIDYWGKERLQLSDKGIQGVIDQIYSAYDKWDELIKNSFLSAKMMQKYFDLLEIRKQTLDQ